MSCYLRVETPLTSTDSVGTSCTVKGPWFEVEVGKAASSVYLLSSSYFFRLSLIMYLLPFVLGGFLSLMVILSSLDVTFNSSTATCCRSAVIVALFDLPSFLAFHSLYFSMLPQKPMVIRSLSSKASIMSVSSCYR